MKDNHIADATKMVSEDENAAGQTVPLNSLVMPKTKPGKMRKKEEVVEEIDRLKRKVDWVYDQIAEKGDESGCLKRTIMRDEARIRSLSWVIGDETGVCIISRA